MVFCSHQNAVRAMIVRTAFWNIPEARNAGTVEHKVALLTATQFDAESSPQWCMGLLVAPDALLTFAHCVASQNISWAYFGGTIVENMRARGEEDAANAGSDPVQTTILSSNSSDNNSSGSNATAYLNVSSMARPTNRFLRSQETNPDGVNVGDVEEWVSTFEIIFHPDYDSSSSSKSPAADLAIVRLKTSRDVEPFQLLPDEHAMANQSIVTTNKLQGYKVTSDFLQNADASKAQPIGSFRRVDWHLCLMHQPRMSDIFMSTLRPPDQMCVTAQTVEKRVPLDTSNSFVMIGDQLAGVSVCHSPDCVNRVLHPYVLVASIRDFIESATRKQDVWTDFSLFTIGGSDAVVQGYLAGLRKSTKQDTNYCLGALVAPDFVLTAAHCVYTSNGGGNVAPAYASVGSRYASSDADGEQIKVKRVLVHPKYDPKTFQYDFALVELKYISIQTPIMLDNEANDDLYKTQRLTLYGYASSSSALIKPPAIQSLSLPLVDSAQCKKLVGSTNIDATTMVCAGGEAQKDGCQGDSGAPLVQEFNGPDQYLVALSSFGWGCGIAGVPAVYAKVSAAMEFIEAHVRKHTWRYALETAVQPSSSSAAMPSITTISGSSETTSHFPSSEDWPSGSGASVSRATISSDATVEATIDSIVTRDHWTRTNHISLDGLHLLVIPATTSQFTRDTVATTLLVDTNLDPSVGINDGNDNSEQERSYACFGQIAMYSSADLSGIAQSVSTFGMKVLRTRKTRFTRTPGVTRLPVE
uniref:Peptidase S1 domain-containing protein n=1 Tax=Globisporangium ultimum (strain ATCC 200006 / CBS 805.95 / DAOM BR144) TaxID=431595 RepID=K3WBJ3_GLOUD